MEFGTKEAQIKYINNILEAKEKFLLDKDNIFTDSHILDNSEILYLLNILKEFIPNSLYLLLESKLNFVKDLNNNQFLRLDCFLNYLFVFNFKEVNSSTLIINSHKNTICILYEESNFSPEAKRIVITCGAKDFNSTIISSKEGLAEISGTFAFKFPEGYHKFPRIFKVLV